MINDSEGSDGSRKRAIKFGLEPLTKNYDSADEINKEPSNDCSKDIARSIDLHDRDMEGSHEEHGVKGEIGALNLTQKSHL